jgi:uncharacterized membrane protein
VSRLKANERRANIACVISCHAVSDGSEVQQLREQVALLTQRVYRLEQLLAAQMSEQAQQVPVTQQVSESAQPTSTPPPPPAAAGSPPRATETGVQAPPLPQARRKQEQESLESLIGGRWLNRVGVVAVLIGAALFLQYAFENHWIGPTTRVLIGMLAGAGAIAWSERVRRQGMLAFSYSMKAIGAGLLYLSLWAACQVYALLPVQVAFFSMVLVTALIAWLAVVQNAELLAGMALLGGVLTPVLLSTGRNEEAALLTYLLVLDIAAVAVQRWRQWPRIAAGAWLGTTMLYVAWFNQFYQPEAFEETIAFLAAFFLLFALAPELASAHLDSERAIRTNWWALLAVVNTAAFFAEMQSLESGHAYRTVLLAMFMLALSIATERRYSGDAPRMVLARVQLGLGLALLIIAVPVRFNADGQAICWLLEAAAFYAAGVVLSRELARLFGAFSLALATLYVLFEMWDKTQPHLLMNERFALYVSAIAILGAMLWTERQRFSDVPPQFLLLGLIALNLLALMALNLEVRDYYRQEVIALGRQLGETVSSAYRSARRSLNTAEDFSHSAVWMLYGVALMWLGFVRRTAVLRWQALVLIGATVLKVFLYDLAVLERGYRIASFIVLGAILLAISYAYQRDWLGLRRIEG